MGIHALIGPIQYLVRYGNAAFVPLPPKLRTKADEQSTTRLLRISRGSKIPNEGDETNVRALMMFFEMDRQDLSEERTHQQASLRAL